MSDTKLVLCILAGVFVAVGGYLTIATVVEVKDQAARNKRGHDIAVRWSSASKVGLSAVLYAGDSNDMLPGPKDFRSRLAYYLRDRPKAADGFIWTFKGGSTKKLPEDFATELGHFDDWFGTTTVYVDGGVRQKLTRR